MTSIKLTVTGARARASVTGPLTSGMVGIPVTIEYDEAWDGLTKNLMCRCSPWRSKNGETRAILNVGENAAVAHEVMQSDMYLYLGVEGFSDDGTLVIPTTWARCGKIVYGANTCEDPSTDPELSVWNQLQTEMEQIKEYTLTQEQVADIQAYAQKADQAAQEAKQAADEAKQAAANVGGNGLYYTPVVTQPTSDTLKFEFKPSVTGAPVPKPVTVKLPAGEDSDETGNGLTAAQVNALDGMLKVCTFTQSDVSAQYNAFLAAFGLSGSGDDDSGGSDEGNLLNFSGGTVVYNGTGTATILGDHAVTITGGYACIAVNDLTPGAQYSFDWAALPNDNASVYGSKVKVVDADPGSADLVKIKSNGSMSAAGKPYVFTLPETCTAVIFYPYDGTWEDLSLREVEA